MLKKVPKFDFGPLVLEYQSGRERSHESLVNRVREIVRWVWQTITDMSSFALFITSLVCILLAMAAPISSLVLMPASGFIWYKVLDRWSKSSRLF